MLSWRDIGNQSPFTDIAVSLSQLHAPAYEFDPVSILNLLEGDGPVNVLPPAYVNVSGEMVWAPGL